LYGKTIKIGYNEEAGSVVVLYGYPGCGTCQKAERWLKAHDISYTYKHIVESPPTKVELKQFLDKSGLPIKKFFNTSGRRYRELGMKDKLKETSEDELLNWLASDGMLIKRPIVTDQEHVTVGFDKEQFTEVWGQKQRLGF
jgi:arsenate reductase